VKALLADGPIMWIGSSGGVIRYDTLKDEHRIFNVRSGLLSNGVFHLNKIGGRLVVGTYGGGLSVFDGETETWENFNIQHGLADAFVYDVLEASNGDVWIATWSGNNGAIGNTMTGWGPPTNRSAIKSSSSVIRPRSRATMPARRLSRVSPGWILPTTRTTSCLWRWTRMERSGLEPGVEDWLASTENHGETIP
jgi:hypothetical protein